MLLLLLILITAIDSAAVNAVNAAAAINAVDAAAAVAHTGCVDGTVNFNSINLKLISFSKF